MPGNIDCEVSVEDERVELQAFKNEVKDCHPLGAEAGSGESESNYRVCLRQAWLYLGFVGQKFSNFFGFPCDDFFGRMNCLKT